MSHRKSFIRVLVTVFLFRVLSLRAPALEVVLRSSERNCS